MSTLVENVAKVMAAHASLKDAIAAKGISIPDGTKLSEMPALVDQIETCPAPTSMRTVFAYDTATSLIVPKVLFVDFRQSPDLSYFFGNCTQLTSITLPDGIGQVTTILRGCFSNCTALTSLTLPDGFGKEATNLSYCFNNCTALTSLTLPDGFGKEATNLSYCFSGCVALETITGSPNFKTSLILSNCVNLTHDSLMVVINGLQTVANNQRLALGSTNLEKLTDDEKKIATDKGWTLA